MAEYSPATIATRRRAVGRRFIRLADGIAKARHELALNEDEQFITATEIKALAKIEKVIDSCCVALVKLGDRLEKA